MRAKDEHNWKTPDDKTWTLDFEHKGWTITVKVVENLHGGFNWSWNASTGVGKHGRYEWSHTLRSAKNGAVRSVRKWIDGLQVTDHGR